MFPVEVSQRAVSISERAWNAARLPCAAMVAAGAVSAHAADPIVSEYTRADGVIMVVGDSYTLSTLNGTNLVRGAAGLKAGETLVSAFRSGNTLPRDSEYERVVLRYAECLTSFDKKDLTLSFEVFGSPVGLYYNHADAKQYYNFSSPEVLVTEQGQNATVQITPRVGQFVVVNDAVPSLQVYSSGGEPLGITKAYVDRNIPIDDGVVTYTGGYESEGPLDETGQKILASEIELAPVIEKSKLPPPPEPVITLIEKNGERTVQVSFTRQDPFPVKLLRLSLNGTEWHEVPVQEVGGKVTFTELVGEGALYRTSRFAGQPLP